MSKKGNLKEIASVFFKLGLISFGGPAAHISMMEEEVVEKRKWMTRQHFLDLVGATNLIPGPNSTQMTMHCGQERGGIPGLIVAGVSFILPAVSLTLVFAYLYIAYGELPQVEPFIYGIKPAVLAIIAGAIFKLGKKALKNWELAILGVLVGLASAFGVNEIVALLVGGVIGATYFYFKSNSSSDLKSLFPILLLKLPAVSAPAITNLSIFWTFLKVASVLFGSGYVLFAYLDAELVTKGWLTRSELIDAIAIGQFTPGPVLTTATFIGYQLSGFTGAMAATLGIFLPSFLFVAILNPLIPRMRKSVFLSYFLDSVNIAAVAVMLVVLFEMGIDSLTDWRTIVIAVLGFVFTFGTKKVNAMWIVFGGSILGFVLSLF